MPNPTIRVHDIETDEIIDREMTAAEYKKHQDETAAMEALINEKEAALVAKAALLDRLGITEAEAKLLLQ
jgi:hypothetical protein